MVDFADPTDGQRRGCYLNCMLELTFAGLELEKSGWYSDCDEGEEFNAFKTKVELGFPSALRVFDLLLMNPMCKVCWYPKGCFPLGDYTVI
jgi:hypothetical protein